MNKLAKEYESIQEQIGMLEISQEDLRASICTIEHRAEVEVGNLEKKIHHIEGDIYKLKVQLEE